MRAQGGARSAPYGKSGVARDAIRYVRDIYVEEEKDAETMRAQWCSAARVASARLERIGEFTLYSPFSMAARVLKRNCQRMAVVKGALDRVKL